MQIVVTQHLLYSYLVTLARWKEDVHVFWLISNLCTNNPLLIMPQSDKFRFEISSFERSSGKNEESDGSVSSTMRRKMQSGAKKAHGESEGDDTSVSIEVDLREALGDLADDFLGDGNDGDPADAQPSTLPAAQGDGSKDVSDQRVQGFVLIGDLLVSDKAKNVNAPVDIGNIADVTRLCSISAPTQPWSNSRHGW